MDGGSVCAELRGWRAGQTGEREEAERVTHLFQWVLELRYSAGNMMGRILAALSLIRLMMYSLFQ